MNKLVKRMLAAVIIGLPWIGAYAQKDFFHADEVSAIEFTTAAKYPVKIVYDTHPVKLEADKAAQLLEGAQRFVAEKYPSLQVDWQKIAGFWSGATSCYFLPLTDDLTYWINASEEQGIFSKSHLMSIDNNLMVVWDDRTNGAIELHFYNNFMFEDSYYLNWDLELKPYQDIDKSLFVAEGGSLYFSAVRKSGPDKGKFVFMKLKKVVLPGERDDERIVKREATPDAVLLADDLKLMNSRHQVLRSVKGQLGQFVKVVSVGSTLEKATPDAPDCERFQYVNVRSPRFTGWLTGTDVYALLKSDNNYETIFNKKPFALIETHNYGVGISNEEGEDSGCNVINPTVLSDGAYRGLIELAVRTVKSDAGNYTIPMKETKYFEITDDQSARMRVTKVEKEGNAYLVTLDIIYPDDEGRITYRISPLTPQKYVAEPIEYVFY